MRWFTVCFPFRYTHVRPRRRHLRYIYPFTAMRKMCYGKVPHRNQISIRSQGTLSVTQRSAAYSMKSLSALDHITRRYRVTIDTTLLL